MKKSVLITLLFFGAVLISQAQYTLFKTVDGVEVYTKWGHEKWYSKKSPKVLLVKLVNTNEHHVTVELGIEFFKGIQLLEEAKPSKYCVNAKGKALPRMRGLMFKPEDSGAETFEMDDITVSKTDKCE